LPLGKRALTALLITLVAFAVVPQGSSRASSVRSKNPVADTWLNQVNPKHNYGRATSLASASNAQALFRFDVSGWKGLSVGEPHAHPVEGQRRHEPPQRPARQEQLVGDDGHLVQEASDCPNRGDRHRCERERH
jgi:hypothetical protein